MDANGVNGVNRSASCASEHVSAMLSGLPRRADTFGGFDSQQRANGDHPSNATCKALYQVIMFTSKAIISSAMFFHCISYLQIQSVEG